MVILQCVDLFDIGENFFNTVENYVETVENSSYYWFYIFTAYRNAVLKVLRGQILLRRVIPPCMVEIGVISLLFIPTVSCYNDHNNCNIDRALCL